MADVARQHGTTRWQIYDWRKRLAKGLLALPADLRSPQAFAAVVVEPDEMPPVTAPVSSDGIIDLVVGGITIRVGMAIDEAHLVRVIRAARTATASAR